jgi:hypothetical protein
MAVTKSCKIVYARPKDEKTFFLIQSAARAPRGRAPFRRCKCVFISHNSVFGVLLAYPEPSMRPHGVGADVAPCLHWSCAVVSRLCRSIDLELVGS